MRLGVKSVPAQNVISRPANKDVYKNVGKLLVTTFYQSKVFLQIWRIDREISFVILVKKLDLIVNVPCAFVAWCRRQKAAALTRRKKRLENPITLRVGMSEVMALVDENKVAITILNILQQKIW